MARFLRDLGKRLHLVSHEAEGRVAKVNHEHDANNHLHNNHIHHHGHHNHHDHDDLHRHHAKRSDTEDGETRGAVGGGTALNQNQLDEYHRLAKECWDTMWDYLTSPESEWKHQTGDSVEDGIIHSRHVKGYGKIFRLQGKVHLDAKRLWEEMVHNINHAPQWNPTLLECNTVLVINHTTDISHNIANEAGGGIISSRDFVNLRHWGVREGIYISAGVGVTHPDCPPSKKHIRGYNGPGGWAFKPVPGEPNTCIFIWVMNTDIKGWVPQRVVDQAAAGVLLDYLNALRKHVKDFKPSV